MRLLIPGPSTCECSIQMMCGSWYSPELREVPILLMHLFYTCFGKVFVLDTNAEATFASGPSRKFLFPGWEIPVSPLLQSWEKCLVLSE